MADKPAKRALVTGGSSGIGRCVAETLARDGCDVGIFYLGEEADGRAVCERIESLGRRAWSRVGDVRESEQVDAAVETFVAELGGIDILVNNAGVFRDTVIWKMSDAQWCEVIDIDLSGMFRFARAVVPTMRKQGSGSIVNVSSINGLRGKFGQTNYSAAKAGVIGFTKALARETARFGVTVNAVAPGMIQTPILDAIPAGELEKSVDEILLGRIGQPEDVAELISFLCSERARFITGEVIRVDGGQCI